MNPNSALSSDPTLPAVSAGNPCPFLRALVAGGWLHDDVEALGVVRDAIVRVSGQTLPGATIAAIALIANGISPAALLRNARQGLHLDALRDGPLDKHGSGSRILDTGGQVVAAELERLAGFARAMPLPAGGSEPGLSLAEITVMMDANFERARDTRRRVDRALMNGEWPVLLKVMGKDAADGTRYLSVEEVRTLFRHRRLPGRLADRLGAGPGASMGSQALPVHREPHP